MTAGRQALLIAAPWVYHPACGIGGGVLCFEVLRRLAAHFDIHWLSFDHTVNDLEGGKRLLAEHCASATFVPLPHHRHKLLWLAQLLGGPPVEAGFMRSKTFRQALRDIAERQRVDLVLCQFPELAQYLDAVPAVPVAMDVQDVWTVSRFRQLRVARGWRRLDRAVNWWAWARHELRYYRKADLLIALTDNDLGVLRSFVPEVRSVVSPAGVEIGPEASRDTPPAIVMLGNYAHAPNRDGLDWLIEAVWPRVRAERPDAILRIAGAACPPPAPGDAALGIERAGFVDDLDALFREARASVVPYRFGGGIKIKALEAMARGCPVVATPIGAEGLDAEDGQSILIGEDAAGLAAALGRMLADPAFAGEVGAGGRALVASRFSYEAKVSRLVAGLREIIARHAPAA